MSRKIGLIAGVGRLPGLLAQAARSRGDRVVVIRALPDAPHSDVFPCETMLDIFIGKWDQIVGALKAHDVENVYLAGKISREHLFHDGEFDERFQRVLSSVNARNDDAIVAGFIADLEREGIITGEQAEYLAPLRCRPGVLTSFKPTAGDWQDIAAGYRVAKTVAGLDVGQTVVMKEGAVVAVEAVDGTDAAIARGSQIAQGGTVVVKVAKPNQDQRFDVPTIGKDTLETLAKHGASLLAFEADQTFLIDQAEMVGFCERHGIALVAYAPGLEGQ